MTVRVLHAWFTRSNGLTVVDGDIPELVPQGAAWLQTHVLEPYREIVARHSARTGVPEHWIHGMIYAESGGNARAVSSDGGHGLLQLTSAGARKGRTVEELLDPDVNVGLGADLIAAIRRTVGEDLPSAASVFNAGGNPGPWPSTVSPWGMRETRGHIDRVVRASNTAFRLLGMVAPVGGP